MDLIDIDEELIRMPVLIQDAGESCAIANELRESAKEEFERMKAHIAQQVREAPTTGKARSETMIESQLPLYEPYKLKQTELGQARLDAALWMTIIEALRAKSMAMRVAADLLNSGFITSDHVRNKRRREIREVSVT